MAHKDLEQRIAYARQYYTDHLDKIRAQTRKWAVANPEKTLEYARQFRKTHKPRIADNTARYRARKASTFVEKVDRQVAWVRDEGICGICQEAADPTNWHLDHIKPLSKGGEHSYQNVQVTHPTCNRRKAATYEE